MVEQENVSAADGQSRQPQLGAEREGIRKNNVPSRQPSRRSPAASPCTTRTTLANQPGSTGGLRHIGLASRANTEGMDFELDVLVRRSSQLAREEGRR
jgi:hypothetical protein